MKKGPQLYFIPINLVISAKYNPKNRDSVDNKDIKDLATSIKEVGQLNPVNLTKKGNKYDLADGHRRIAALKLLKRTEVLAHINGPETAKTYQHINHNVKQHTPNQRLQSFLVNSQTTPMYLRTAFKNMVKEVGRPIVKRMAKEGYSLGTYKQACSVGRYTGLSSLTVLEYIMKTKQTYALRSAMELDWSPKDLRTIIKSGKPLTV
jgi:hypothetical protein